MGRPWKEWSINCQYTSVTDTVTLICIKTLTKLDCIRMLTRNLPNDYLVDFKTFFCNREKSEWFSYLIMHQYDHPNIVPRNQGLLVVEFMTLYWGGQDLFLWSKTHEWTVLHHSDWENLDKDYWLVQFCQFSEFVSSNYFQIGQHVVLLHTQIKFNRIKERIL